MQEERTILFVDVVGSTEMYPRLGNVKAKELILTFLAELQEIVEAGKGELVKPPIGDELMCMFARPMDAALAACEMQRFAEGRNREESDELFVRIGFHAGDVVLDKNDVFGDAVNTAARVAAEASRERILTTRETAESLRPELAPFLRDWNSAALKGKADEVELFELAWRAMTDDNRKPPPSKKKYQRAVLKYRGEEYTLEPGGKPITFGRSTTNEIVIDDPTSFISGAHGQIEFRGGQSKWWIPVRTVFMSDLNGSRLHW